MFISALIILISLFIFDFTGYVVLKKIKRENYLISLPLGFMLFMGIFEFLSLFSMVNKTNFVLYRNSLLILLVIVYSILIFKNLDYFTTLKIRYSNRFKILVTVFSLIAGLLISILATGYGDSWLYSSMILSSIDNNIIFSNNGISIGGEIQSFHYTDGIYLLQSILTSLSPIDNYVFLVTFVKFLEGVIIVSTIGFVVDFFIKKNKSIVFIVVAMFLLLGKNLFTRYPTGDEIYTHTFRSIMMGTNLINNVGIILAVILIISNIKIKYKQILMPIVGFALFSFTSSSLFMFSSLLVIAMYVEVFGRKSKDGMNYIVSGFGVVYIFALVYYLSSSPILMLIGAIVGIIAFSVAFYLVQKLSYEKIKKILKIGLILYILITIVGIFVLRNTNVIFNSILELDHSKIYDISGHYYLNIFASLLYLVLFIVGLIDIYKNKKLLGNYLIFAFILFANPLSYRIFGSVVQQVVYHRIFNLICPGLISIIGFAALINYFDNKYQFRNYKYAYAVLVPLVLFFPTYQVLFTGFDSFEEYKYQSKDIMELSNWDYPKTKNINPGGILPNPVPDTYNDLDQILRTRGDLNWVDCTSNQDFYLILPKEQAIDKEIEFQTELYNVYLIRGEECLVNKN